MKCKQPCRCKSPRVGNEEIEDDSVEGVAMDAVEDTDGAKDNVVPDATKSVAIDEPEW